MEMVQYTMWSNNRLLGSIEAGCGAVPVMALGHFPPIYAAPNAAR